MTYIEYSNRFWSCDRIQRFSGSATRLYFALLAYFNEARNRETNEWPGVVQLDNLDVMALVGTRTEQVIIAARKELVQAGLLSWQRGVKGNPSRYFLLGMDGTAENAAQNTIEFPSEKTRPFPGNLLKYPCQKSRESGGYIIYQSNTITYSTESTTVGENKKKLENTEPGKKTEKETGKITPAQIAQREYPGILGEQLTAWLQYKKAAGYPYGVLGFQKLIESIRPWANRYGEEKVANLIQNTIAHKEWKLFLDRLERPERMSRPGRAGRPNWKRDVKGYGNSVQTAQSGTVEPTEELTELEKAAIRNIQEWAAAHQEELEDLERDTQEPAPAAEPAPAEPIQPEEPEGVRVQNTVSLDREDLEQLELAPWERYGITDAVRHAAFQWARYQVNQDGKPYCKEAFKCLLSQFRGYIQESGEEAVLAAVADLTAQNTGTFGTRQLEQMIFIKRCQLEKLSTESVKLST